MNELVLCSACKRHVGMTESACPFCGNALVSAAPRPALTAARLGRAAIFAGATLTACVSSSSPRKDDTIEHKQTDQHVVEVKPGPVPPGSIRGTVRDQNGAFIPSYPVMLISESGITQNKSSDQRGEFEFSGLEPGNYTVTSPTHNPRIPQPSVPVTLQPENGERADLTIYSAEPDRGPCCKPYGAPPARRRIV